jgi:hypothetical protein
MPDRSLSNARIQGWLADDLARVAGETDSTRALVNSAAVWWFCHRLSPEERARILGEFVTAQAMRNSAPAAPPPPANNRRRGKGKGGG